MAVTNTLDLVVRLSASKVANTNFSRAQMCSPVLDLKSQRFLSRANLCLLGCFLLAGLLYLTLDNVVQLIVLSGFSLQKGGEFTEIWKNPPPDLFLRVNYFNLTNPEEFFSGRERAVVKEVGPYSYRQRWARKILTWNDEDNTISYSIRKVYTFLPEKSIGGQDDVITTANIPAVSAYYQMRDANFFTALGLNMVVESLEYKPWVRRTVGELSWGYEEPLFKLASYTLPSPPPFEKFGLFTGKNNSELPTFYTMHTGRDDFRKFSHIFEADGKEQMGFWGSEECDHVKGSDGGAFNPYISKEDELRLFDRQICRSIPMRYVKEVISEDGLPGYRFVPLAETLLHPRTHPENECFCRDPDICKLIGDGMYDLSSCQYGAPIVLSWPHFMNATLPDGVCTAEGMSPDPERHLMYFDVEPLTGTTLAARVRLQVSLYCGLEVHT